MVRNKLVTESIVRVLEQARYEVLPTPSTEDKLLAHVPRDRVVTVTASPSKGLEATFDLAERLTGHGYAVVPHVAARMVSGRTELAEICDSPCWRTSLPWVARSPTSGSPAIPSRTPRSPTTSPCRRCGTSAATPPTWSATSRSTPR
jgi:hypothetical protein